MESWSIVLEALGGLGLFLLGMILMTDGLRSLAGDTVRANLMRFTRTPLSGAVTGALCTTALQSSSATTVAAVGFVAADLMPFVNALGIVFGANIGSTATGWLVALLGFKFDLATLALPLVFSGMLLRLLGRGAAAQVGLALAGFALVFVGIAHMQEGMRGLESLVRFDELTATTLLERGKLVLLGLLFTVMTQASSAAVAAALTALHSGYVDFPAAACFVIGADVGTTVSAALATIGAPLDARRTGYSHVIYNVGTALIALALVDMYAAGVGAALPGLMAGDPEFVLVGFHTTFNVLGVVLVLPFARPFAHLVKRLVRARPGEAVPGLDERMLVVPMLALSALHKAVEQAFLALIAEIGRVLGRGAAGTPLDLERMQAHLDDMQEYAAAIDLRGTRGGEWSRLIALLHALDHLQRLHERLEEEAVRARTARQAPELHGECVAFLGALAAIAAQVGHGQYEQARTTATAASVQQRDLVQSFRDATTQAMAARTLSIEAGTGRLEAVRWLRRVGRHVARVSHHLAAAVKAAGT